MDQSRFESVSEIAQALKGNQIPSEQARIYLEKCLDDLLDLKPMQTVKWKPLSMRAMLSDTQKEQFEKVSDRQSELTDLPERRTLTEGFRLAVKIIVDVMNTMETSSVDD